MGQPGCFDLDERYRGLDAKKDPLLVLNAVVPWEDFRAGLSAVGRKPDAERKNAAGRKPWDEIIIFKTLVLQALDKLSDDQVEDQIRDRLSFMRFLGLGLKDRVPDATTVWLYREKLAQAGLVEALLDAFDAHRKSRGSLARGGQIVDASLVSAPVQRNSRAENKAIKAGDPPAAWKPNKTAQKDVDARWTKKHGKSSFRYFGDKNPVNIDRKPKLMRRYMVTDAAVHDSQTLEDLLDPHNTASDVWADTADRSTEREEKLAATGLRSRIDRRASRGQPLSQRAQEANRTRSKVRSRVEPVFGHQPTSMGGQIVRTIGLVRAKAKIGLMNLVSTISRCAFLERTATPA
jgi:IS5 family transposase